MDKWFCKKLRDEALLRRAILIICVIVLLFVNACKKKTVTPVEEAAEGEKKPSKLAKAVLHSELAGRWYPADAEVLNKQIGGFFEKADVEPIDDVIAVILPHAGYQYSGQTASAGLKSSNSKYKRVIIIGPSHYMRMEEVLSVPRVTHYQTPLGEVAVDVSCIDKLLEYPMFQNVPSAHQNEHSVQIEIPLLQYCQERFSIIPIVAGDCSLETIKKAAGILKSFVDENTLVVASSDFTHYGANYGYVPFSEDVPEKIKQLDMGAYEYIAALDAEGFLKYKKKTGATICGYVPIAILLSMMEGAKAHLVKYTTSGEMAGSFSNSVSYLAVAFAGKWQKNSPDKPQTSSSELSEDDRQRLLTLARGSLLYALKHRKVPEAADLGVDVSEAMKEPRAAFVTLEKNSQLRGCIGDIFPQRPLYKSVITNAINAGFNDRRFYPVTEAECNEITIEISALTVPQPIDSAEQIRIGIDGVVLNKDGHSAVFLPQVAPEQGWDVKEMLKHLSMKAGLAPDAWQEGTRFLVFQAEVFGEEK